MKRKQLPDWAIGPFARHPVNPVLSPSPEGFDSWTAYNPAVAVKDGLFHMFYRAESLDEKDTPYMGTSRIGHSTSQDGIHWTKTGNLVIDATEEYEIPGGCEDPRIVWAEGWWHLLYTGYRHPDVFICDAVSRDLVHWEKKGPLFKPEYSRGIQSKSAAVVCDPEGRALRIDGRYILYTNTQLAFSENFENWEVHEFSASEFSGKPHEVCVAVTDHRNPGNDDILLFIAGSLDAISGTDTYFYAIGQALYSRKDPRQLLDYVQGPVMYAQTSWEQSIDRFPHHPAAARGTLFLDSLFRHEGMWWMYYGASDQYVALAQAEAR